MKKTIVSLILILAASSLVVKRADAQVFSVGVSIHAGPPVIPVYTQPVCPVDGYLWVPGYWAYDNDYGYYWVPGYWSEPPQVGFLWTPGYWGYVGGVYAWNAGYWGPHIGFYGGVNYGCGYYGSGFAGGNWVGGHFRYNTAVVNVNTTIVHNTYIDRTVINNTTVNRVSYNGGPGGVAARPSPAEQRVSLPKTPNQCCTCASPASTNFSGSITTAAPTPRPHIAAAASRSVCPGPTVRTTADIPSRTSMAPPRADCNDWSSPGRGRRDPLP